MLLVELGRIEDGSPAFIIDCLHATHSLAFLDDVWAEGPLSIQLLLEVLDPHQAGPV